jgi:O-antigen ligase
MAAGVSLLLVWVTFPAGGVYPWVWVPAACAALLLTVWTRPQIASDPTVRTLDAMVILAGVAVALQLVPLPLSVLRRVDPHVLSLRAALWLPPQAADAMTPLPITISARDTLAALGIFAGAALLFWSCRHVCEAGSTGRIVRSIAIIGIVGSLAAIIQRAESKELLYGYWRPLDAGARPYGPFVNRNHFATWAIMACPLIFGYLLARAPGARQGRPLSQRIANAVKQLGSIRAWLASAVCLLTLAVVVSASRSGVIGLICAFATSMCLAGWRQQPHTRRWTMLQAALLAIVVLSLSNLNPLAGRIDETLAASSPQRGRTAIWGDTVRLIRDFRWTGTGAGTFGTAIVPYQTKEQGYTIGQAHNHYLQIAAEGGFMLFAVMALILASFLLVFRRRLAEDEGADYLIRAGAAAGIAGVLLQSFWETGLRMPANAMLFAVLAAIATQRNPRVRSDGYRH